MLSAKSNEQASKFLVEGDECLGQLKFFEALVAFNQCLSHAERGSIEMACGFEARSRVFYAIKQWGKCLRNVKFAREFGFANGNVLDVREAECRKNLKIAVTDPSEDLRGFFQLSFPPHEKIPYIAECLEIHENEIYGRFVIATQPLSPGDVIAIEQPIFNFICPSAITTNCFNCLSTNMLDLIPSSTSGSLPQRSASSASSSVDLLSVMFCSEKCLAEGYKKFNGREELILDSLCGNDIRQKMLRVMSDSLFAAGSFEELQNLASCKSVFDFDFSDPSDEETRKKLLICENSFLPKTDSGIVVGYLKNILNLAEGPKKDFFVKFIAKIILSYMRNGVKLPGRGTNAAVGGMLMPFVALLNHSCDPNIYASFVNSKCHLIVMKPVKANEQIFVNYRFLLSHLQSFC